MFIVRGIVSSEEEEEEEGYPLVPQWSTEAYLIPLNCKFSSQPYDWVFHKIQEI